MFTIHCINLRSSLISCLFSDDTYHSLGISIDFLATNSLSFVLPIEVSGALCFL